MRRIFSFVQNSLARLLHWLSVGKATNWGGLLRLYWEPIGSAAKWLVHQETRFQISPFGLVKLGVAVLLFAFLLVVGALMALSIPDRSIAGQQPMSSVIFPQQGWGTSLLSRKRQEYYYTPQGTSLKNLRSAWFVNLEQAWQPTRLADPDNMSRLGFIVDKAPTPLNPYSLPVGFTTHFVPALNDRVVDITCAACHTGQLSVTTVKGDHVGIRIDGGEATHAFTSLSAGQFGPSLVTSMLATAINPLKFHHFAQRVVASNLDFKAELALYRDFWSVLAPLSAQAFSDIRRNLYPVTEGYGRIDAVGRIANHVFGDELDTKNYHPGNAPVSYPVLWDIWKFDWVQYTASVSQPLARNLGETLGVGAELSLCDRYDQPLQKDDRYVSSALIPNLVKVEGLLQELRAPDWDQEILGKIDSAKTRRGKSLFQEHCAGCHQPCEMNEEDKAVLAPGKLIADQEHQDVNHLWHLNRLPVNVIGTDPTAALNFVNNTYDLTKTGLSVEDVRAELRKSWEERKQRINDYRASHGQPPVQMDDYIDNQLAAVNVQAASVGAGLNYIGMFLRRKYYQENKNSTNVKPAEFNGFDALDLPEVKLQYKARPLEGVWATAPYLHNGSVKTLYEMLLPADQRCKKFFVGREFDRVKIGLAGEPYSTSGFWLDTAIQGNWNIGHEFRDGYLGYPANGVIGPKLTDSERWAIIEYLKIHKDEPAPPCQRTYSEQTAYGASAW